MFLPLVLWALQVALMFLFTDFGSEETLRCRRPFLCSLPSTCCPCFASFNLRG